METKRRLLLIIFSVLAVCPWLTRAQTNNNNEYYDDLEYYDDDTTASTSSPTTASTTPTTTTTTTAVYRTRRLRTRTTASTTTITTTVSPTRRRRTRSTTISTSIRTRRRRTTTISTTTTAGNLTSTTTLSYSVILNLLNGILNPTETRLVVQGQSGPQCKYGAVYPHVLCLDDSHNLASLGRICVNDVLDMHNFFRGSVQPSPKSGSLTNVKWDIDLAIMAERWAAQCTSGSSLPKNRILPDRGSNGPEWSSIGENVCLANSLSESTSISCIRQWARGMSNWKYGVGQINITGPQVYEYAQLIRQEALFVGCGKAECSNTSYRYVMVCMYGSGGVSGRPGGVDPISKPYDV